MKPEKTEVSYRKKKLRKNEIGLIIEIDKGKLLEILSKRQIHI